MFYYPYLRRKTWLRKIIKNVSYVERHIHTAVAVKSLTTFQDGWKFIAATIAEQFLTEYNAKNITAKEAAEKIKDCDMSNVDRFHEFNKNLIEEIQKENSKNVPFEENEVVESTSENEEIEIETRKPVRSRKRK